MLESYVILVTHFDLFPFAIAMTPRKLMKMQDVCPAEMLSPLSSMLVKVTRIELKPTIAMQGPVTPCSMALKSRISADTPRSATEPFSKTELVVIFEK